MGKRNPVPMHISNPLNVEERPMIACTNDVSSTRQQSFRDINSNNIIIFTLIVTGEEKVIKRLLTIYHGYEK